VIAYSLSILCAGNETTAHLNERNSNPSSCKMARDRSRIELSYFYSIQANLIKNLQTLKETIESALSRLLYFLCGSSFKKDIYLTELAVVVDFNFS
jgi:hypothetical protein